MNGLVLLDKPSGITSFTAASIMKRAYSTKRVGHTGTLDPLATGVLPILIGRATRLSGYVLESDKSYIATVKLGITTDTLDITGNIMSTDEVNVSEEKLIKTIASFVGEISQVPPMYSAIRVGGRRLYDLARDGVEIERESRKITVNSIDLLSFKDDEFVIDVNCSKGTYIRTLADDIGRALGCGATMTALRRTSAAGFGIEECTDPDIVKLNPEKYLISPDRAVEQFGKVFVTKAQADRFCHGGELALDRVTLPDSKHTLFRIYDENEFLGLGESDITSGNLNVKCVIAERNI